MAHTVQSGRRFRSHRRPRLTTTPASVNAIVLIEPRPKHFALDVCLANIRAAKKAWESDWQLVFVCHLDAPPVEFLQYRIPDPGSVEGYNQLLTSPELYDWLTTQGITGHILVTQTDAWLCPERGPSGGRALARFADAFDYLGGACTWNANDFYQGSESRAEYLNGGLSLRSMAAVQACLKLCMRNLEEPEDVFFARAMTSLGLRVADARAQYDAICHPRNFAINTLAPTVKVLGVHKPWELDYQDQRASALRASPQCAGWLHTWMKHNTRAARAAKAAATLPDAPTTLTAVASDGRGVQAKPAHRVARRRCLWV